MFGKRQARQSQQASIYGAERTLQQNRQANSVSELRSDVLVSRENDDINLASRKAQDRSPSRKSDELPKLDEKQKYSPYLDTRQKINFVRYAKS